MGKYWWKRILNGNSLISCSIDETIKIYNIEGYENDDNKYNDFVWIYCLVLAEIEKIILIKVFNTIFKI